MASSDELGFEPTAKGDEPRGSMHLAVEQIQSVLLSSVVRIALFLFVAMPIIFLSLMWMGGHAMAYLQGWHFARGYNFMASAITGGAIIFPADPPQRTSAKICATIAGSAGVGLFAFMVATLSNSLVNPIVNVCGLDSDKRTVGGVFAKLGFLASIVMIGNLIIAALFGWVFSLLEPAVDFIPAFKAVAAIELGGGVVFHEQGYPETPMGTVYYSIIGIWAIGVAATMVAVAGGPATGVVEDKFGLALAQTHATINMSVRKLSFLVFIALPIVLFTVMFFVACVMDPLTTWEFEGAFWAALPATTGGAAALHSASNPPLRNSGVVILVCAASAGFFIISLFIGVGSHLMHPIVHKMPVLHTPRGYSDRGSVCLSLAALFAISYILIPFAVFTFAVPMGGLIANVEGWEFHQGFWWCVAVQLGGGMALTTVQISDLAGMVIGTIAVAWSIGISIITVGLSGAPVVVPLMDAMGLQADEVELHRIIDIKHKLAYGSFVSNGASGS